MGKYKDFLSGVLFLDEAVQQEANAILEKIEKGTLNESISIPPDLTLSEIQIAKLNAQIQVSGEIDRLLEKLSGNPKQNNRANTIAAIKSAPLVMASDDAYILQGVSTKQYLERAIKENEKKEKAKPKKKDTDKARRRSSIDKDNPTKISTVLTQAFSGRKLKQISLALGEDDSAVSKMAEILQNDKTLGIVRGDFAVSASVPQKKTILGITSILSNNQYRKDIAEYAQVVENSVMRDGALPEQDAPYLEINITELTRLTSKRGTADGTERMQTIANIFQLSLIQQPINYTIKGRKKFRTVRPTWSIVEIGGNASLPDKLKKARNIASLYAETRNATKKLQSSRGIDPKDEEAENWELFEQAQNKLTEIIKGTGLPSNTAPENVEDALTKLLKGIDYIKISLSPIFFWGWQTAYSWMKPTIFDEWINTELFAALYFDLLSKYPQYVGAAARVKKDLLKETQKARRTQDFENVVNGKVREALTYEIKIDTLKERIKTDYSSTRQYKAKFREDLHDAIAVFCGTNQGLIETPIPHNGTTQKDNISASINEWEKSGIIKIVFKEEYIQRK